MVDKVLSEEKNSGNVEVYVDDILVVTASITEEIRRKRNEIKPTRTSPLGEEPTWTEAAGDEPVEDEPLDTSQRRMTQEERDSGTRSVSHTGQSELTGKLCWCVMALIWWKVGADIAVTEHVVRALEEWLRRRGISIYTDLL
jgi:hypothetical protein